MLGTLSVRSFLIVLFLHLFSSFCCCLFIPFFLSPFFTSLCRCPALFHDPFRFCRLFCSVLFKFSSLIFDLFALILNARSSSVYNICRIVRRGVVYTTTTTKSSMCNEKYKWMNELTTPWIYLYTRRDPTKCDRHDINTSNSNNKNNNDSNKRQSSYFFRKFVAFRLHAKAFFGWMESMHSNSSQIQIQRSRKKSFNVFFCFWFVLSIRWFELKCIKYFNLHLK